MRHIGVQRAVRTCPDNEKPPENVRAEPGDLSPADSGPVTFGTRHGFGSQTASNADRRAVTLRGGSI